MERKSSLPENDKKKKENLVKHPAAWSLNQNGASPILLQLFIRNYRYIFKASTKKTVKFH
jgi:hypothetical protein